MKGEAMFVLGLFFILLGLGLGGFKLYTHGLERRLRTRIDDPNERDTRDLTRQANNAHEVGRYAGIGRWVMLVLGVIVVFSTLYTIVPANTVAIPVTFGKPGAALANGWNWVGPFTDTVEFTTRLQTSERLADVKEGDFDRLDCVHTQGTDGSDMCADLSVYYKLSRDKAPEMFRSYGSFSKIKARVRRVEESSMKGVLASYVPETAILATNQVQIQTDATARIKKDMEAIGVVVDRVLVGTIHFETKVQKRIDARAGARQEKEKAKIEYDTGIILAKKEADSNQIKKCGAKLVDTVSTDDKGKETKGQSIVPREDNECQPPLNGDVLESKYLDTLKTLGGKNTTIIVNSSGSGASPRIDVPVASTK